MLCFSVDVECVSSLAVDRILQMHFLQSGVLWHLLLTLFEYDHTLEESGVENVEGGSNKQFVANNLAKLAVRALARLGGYLPEGHREGGAGGDVDLVPGQAAAPQQGSRRAEDVELKQ